MKITERPRTIQEAKQRRRQVYAVLSIVTAVVLYSVMFSGGEGRTCHVTRLDNGATTPHDFNPRNIGECSEFVEI